MIGSCQWSIGQMVLLLLILVEVVALFCVLAAQFDGVMLPIFQVSLLGLVVLVAHLGGLAGHLHWS